jgi:hypothetical protein
MAMRLVVYKKNRCERSFGRKSKMEVLKGMGEAFSIPISVNRAISSLGK